MMSLEKQVNDYYSSCTLDPAKLESLLKETPRVNQKYWMFMAAAAVLPLLVTSGLFIHAEINSQINRTNQIIMQEAATNHQSKLEPDFVSSEIDVLASAMNGLDFISIPDNINNRYSLIGGRYCTIHGNLAAHIKLRNKSNTEEASLFITKSNSTLSGLEEKSRLLDGVSVSSWSNAGLFYVLAFN